MRSLAGRLDKLLGVGRRDHRDALVGFSILLLTMAGHAMLETARDALFLSALGASRLPWAYLAIAVSTLALARWHKQLSGRFSRRRSLRVTLGAGALVTAVFSLTSAVGDGSALVLPFYVWTGLLATVLVVQFWLLLGEVLDFGQAKRVFALIGSGGLLGAVAGSLLASGVLMFARAEWLPLCAAALFGLASSLPAYLSPARHSSAERSLEPEPDEPSPVLLLAHDAYLRRLLFAVLLGTLTVTVADYLFKSMVARDVASSELGAFFGRYYAIVNGIALLVQLVVAPYLLRTIGVHRAVQLMPAVLLAATLGFVALPGLAAALVLKASDGSLRHSVNRVSQEILFLPLGRQLRSSFRVFTEAVGLRMGQALASILVLSAIALGLPTRTLGWLLLALVATWLAVTLIGLERLYVERFRKELRRGTLRRPARGVDLDRRSIALLETALGSDDDAEVLAALDVYQAYEKTHLLPALILYHPSARIVLRALELLKQEPREDVVGVAGRLLSHPDPEVRAALLRLYVAGSPEVSVLERLRDDDSEAVRATALAGLLHAERAPIEAARELTRIADRGSHSARHALALALPVLPRPLFSSVVDELSTRDDPQLQNLLSRSIAEAPSPDTIPAAIRLLANRDARAAARRALCALGDPALDALDRALFDHSLAHSIRRHLPRTISRFASPRAAEILERGLFVERDPVVRHKILRGLGQMRADDPRLPIDRQRLLSLARQLLDRALTVSTLAELLDVARRRFADPDCAGAELLSAALSDESKRALEHAFRVLHIVEPARELELVHRALTSADRDVRARGRELAEHVVPDSLRPKILALVGDDERVDDQARRTRQLSLPAELREALAAESMLQTASGAAGRERERRFRRALGRALALLRDDQSRPLSAIVENHLVELGLASLSSDPPRAGGEETRHVR